MIVDGYIRRKLCKRIEEFLKQITCDHDWFVYGNGYECLKCEFNTIGDGNLTKAIKDGQNSKVAKKKKNG